MTLEAFMKPPTYPEADHSAPTRPATKAKPALLLEPWRSWTAFVPTSRAAPGVKLAMFLSSVSIVSAPASPSRDSRTSRAGKRERTPEYVSAAASSVRSSSLNSRKVRLSVSFQVPLESWAGLSGVSPRVGVRVVVSAMAHRGYPRLRIGVHDRCT